MVFHISSRGSQKRVAWPLCAAAMPFKQPYKCFDFIVVKPVDALLSLGEKVKGTLGAAKMIDIYWKIYLYPVLQVYYGTGIHPEPGVIGSFISISLDSWLPASHAGDPFDPE